MAAVRRRTLGDRYVAALTGSAPSRASCGPGSRISSACTCRRATGRPRPGRYSSTADPRRPPVLDYKLVDVPELGYLRSDQPYPRGELLLRSTQVFLATTRRPELTAEMFDADGFYRTGDIVGRARTRPVEYIDRRNNVLKLSQGEFQRRPSSKPLHRQSAGAPDLPVRQQHPALPAGRDRADRTCLAQHDPDALQCARRLPEEGRADRRPAVVRGPARLPGRDHPVQRGERSADRHPQARLAQACGALRRSRKTSTLNWPARRPVNCADCAGPGPPARCCRPSSRLPPRFWAFRPPRCPAPPLHRSRRRFVVRVDLRQPTAGRSSRSTFPSGSSSARRPICLPSPTASRPNAARTPVARRTPPCTAGTPPRRPPI